MWKRKILEIADEKKKYGEKINYSAKNEELQVLLDEYRLKFQVELPKEYLDFLRYVNGVEFNGFILYGIDEKLLKEKPRQHIQGIIDNNLIWHENIWENDYIFLGESSISWYVYDYKKYKYYELDNPSGRIMEEFNDINVMIYQLLNEALQ
jgi:hypothetical protein